ncbi:CRISPR-associated endonuclease Cas1 2 [Saccharopolyspora subtropica]|uniref:CRISPR-associated endonuclease Cas1 n=1 Tax=Saccharopolyspora thermophila TaxID=89367 RepID=A0A917K1P7_9PSEU|nr:type I-B CRISPR-associated endonuclease Cas1b [Saccharopolyspora subtropica]GGI95157.1 CRISPR-associated endonuclease Cas1 2 [Saccharopolyspora subtropica]
MTTTARTYWLTSPCRIRRKDNSLRIERDGHEPTYIPITDVRDIIAAAEVDLNTSIISLLNQHRVNIHFLSYYGDYAGSLLPADTATSSQTVLGQTRLATDHDTARRIAASIVDSAAFNTRWSIDRRLLTQPYHTLKTTLKTATSRNQIMAAEGNFRRSAWEALDTKLPDWLQLAGRHRRPPANAGNAVISYANGLVYARVLTALRLTPLHTGVAFLHSTLERHRHSLALDIAELFKPLFAERILLRLAGRNQLKPHHFDTNTGHATLTEPGRKLLITTIRDDLATTVKHRGLGRNVTYDELIYLDALALTRHCLENEPYKPFRAWW